MPTPVGPEEQERAERAIALRQPDAGAPDGVGDDLDGGVLADDALVEVGLELLQTLELARHQLAHRDPGARRDDGRDLGLADLGRPVGAQRCRAALELLDLLLDAPGVLVGLRVHGGLLLGLELLGAGQQAGGLGSLAAQLDARGGLVDEVDRLVGQAVLGDVAVRQPGRRLQGLVGDGDAVVLLVGAAQAVQDRDRLLDGRLLDGDGREPPRQGPVALDRAVLGQRGGADHPQLAAGEQGLEHVGGVHRALGLSGSEHGVQLVDEQHDPALGGHDLGQRGLHPLLELAAELGAGQHAGEVQRHDAGAVQGLRDVVLRDTQREALDDRGLADAGLADQHGVVLAPPGEDLDGLLDLVEPTDHGVDAPGRRVGGQVTPELVERGGAGGRGLGGLLLSRGASGAGRGEQLTGADLAEQGRPTAALSAQHEPDGAGPLAAVRAQLRGRGVGEVHRSVSKSQSGPLRLARTSESEVTAVTLTPGTQSR